MGNPIFCAHFNGNWTESAKNLTATVNGSPSNTTGSAKFGTYCAAYGNTGCYIQYSVDSDFNLGTNDFTIHLWVKHNSTGSNSGYVGLSSSANPIHIIGYENNIDCYMTNGPWPISFGAVTTGTWVHLAITRSGNTFRTFVGGTKINETTHTVSLGNASNVTLGNYVNQYWTTAPNIDEILIYREALWTANFTPPTAEYSTGWAHTINGVSSPAYVCGVAKTSISKVMGV